MSYDDEKKFQTINKEKWIIQDIYTGIPLINKHNTLKYIPQMLNLDQLNAISFSKGCYTGQEVVARVQHRGKVKQRLYQIKTESGVVISPQEEVKNSDKKVGHVVISEADEDVCFGLAAINISQIKNDLSVEGKLIKLIS